MTNEELACAVQRGDTDALAQLWEQVKDYAFRVIVRYRPHPYADTEDYLQTAFLGVRAAALAFDPSRGSFLTVADWYIRSACSRFYRWHRRGEVETISYDVPMKADDPDGGDFKDNFPDDSLPDPWERMEAEDMARDVRAAVDELTERNRRVIDMHYYQGLSLAAISKEEGCSPAFVQQIERRSLKHLHRSKHLVPYKRMYAPHRGVGVGAYRRYGASAVEHVAIKNVDAEQKALREAQRREYMNYVRRVMYAVANGYFPLETGWDMVENYKAQHGMA